MQTNTTTGKEVFSIDEFAALNSISRSTVLTEIKKGKLKSRNIGTRVVIHVSDAREWGENLDNAK
jgi:excisionase family DNA binding protein